MAKPGDAVRALPVEVVSTILRSNDTGPDALYPAQIGVNCDECWTVVERDFLVTDRTTKAERVEFARAALRKEGWSCTPERDLCPPCVTTYREEGL